MGDNILHAQLPACKDAIGIGVEQNNVVSIVGFVDTVLGLRFQPHSSIFINLCSWILFYTVVVYLNCYFAVVLFIIIVIGEIKFFVPSFTWRTWICIRHVVFARQRDGRLLRPLTIMERFKITEFSGYIQKMTPRSKKFHISF